MPERGTVRSAFNKAAGFFYAVVASVIANLVFAYVLPHGDVMEKAAATPREVAVVASLPSAVQVVAPPPIVRAAAAPSLPIATASAAPGAGSRPGPGSGGLY